MKIYLTLLLLGGVLGLLALGHSNDTTGAPSLSVMTYNVGDIGEPLPGLESIVETIRKLGTPDVLFLQEAPGKNGVASLANLLGMRFHVYLPYQKDGASGMAILARTELHNPRILHFKASEMNRGALLAEMNFEGGPIALCSVHMDHISSVSTGGQKILDVSWQKGLSLIERELIDETARTRSTKELLTWPALKRYERVIIGGDFNTIPFSRTIRLMNDRFYDALWPSLEFFKGSYKKTTLPVAPRIDFIFASRGLLALEASVGRKTAGDHYPIRARFAVEGKQPYS